jgi:hypothetical protein
MEIYQPNVVAPGCNMQCLDICFAICLWGSPITQFTNDSVAWVQVAFGTTY